MTVADYKRLFLYSGADTEEKRENRQDRRSPAGI
jgi:hypothetical protein